MQHIKCCEHFFLFVCSFVLSCINETTSTLEFEIIYFRMERDHRDNGLAQGILHHYSLEQQRPAIIQTEANKRHQNNDSMELKQKKCIIYIRSQATTITATMKKTTKKNTKQRWWEMKLSSRFGLAFHESESFMFQIDIAAQILMRKCNDFFF